MASGTMRDKFAKKVRADAIEWLEKNGFTPPYEDARKLDNLPKCVVTYFKTHKLKKVSNETEPGDE